jgi:cytochrome c-type biogenesis protein
MGDATDLVTNGPLALAVLIAAVAGLLSFLSPCVLPLVPGYVSYVTGLAGADLDAALGVDPLGRPVSSGATAVVERTRPARIRMRVLAGSGLFVAGFTAVFTVLGFAAGSAGRWLLVYEPVLERVVGAAVVLLGLAYLGVLPGLGRTIRPALPRAGLAGAPVLGAVFALGWVPCVSPTLGAVLGLAYVEGSAGRGALLAVAYCIGLGVPFVLAGLGMRALLGALGVVRRHAGWVTRIGGVLLIAVGLLLLTGTWGDLVIYLRSIVRPGEIGL